MIAVLDYLMASPPPPAQQLCAVFGDEDYLKHEALVLVRGKENVEYFPGDDTEWRDIHDALTMQSLFGDAASTVVIEGADKFVTRYRDRLEGWVERSQPERLLVLELKTWPGNTRLAKAVEKVGLAIDCRVPVKGKEVTAFNRAARKWLAARATKVHGVKIEGSALERLFDLLPLSLGVLDCEVAKLALLAEGKPIDLRLVEQNVGDWRTREAWDMIDAMVDGRADEAIRQLGKLLAAGEEPIVLLAQIASNLRKFATAARLVEQTEQAGRRVALGSILEQAGFFKFKLDDAQRRLKQIGRRRATQLADWLLAADLAMKGHNSSKPLQRLELERMIVRLSREATLPPGASIGA